MSQYGAKRLIAINSGNYSFANIELTKPVHLAASNNRGKSTLVNSLQFLYIDDFTKMRFGHRNHDDSRRHYFGADRAYLIFECLTPTGIQCMLVRGLSNLRGGQFERYVYDGEFLDADYLDDGNVRFFESVRTRLADRHLTLVRNSDLWQVLAGNLPSDGEKSLPRLNILPLRKREDYLAFRDVFVRLLSLSNVNARPLRQLVIGSHGRQIGERKIDVAAEYKAEFDLAERSEHHLNFIRAAASEIDKGREVRLEIAALTSKFMAVAPRDGLTRLGVTSSLRRKRLRCRRKWPDWNKVAGMRPGRKSHCWSSKVDLRRISRRPRTNLPNFGLRTKSGRPIQLNSLKRCGTRPNTRLSKSRSELSTWIRRGNLTCKPCATVSSNFGRNSKQIARLSLNGRRPRRPSFAGPGSRTKKSPHPSAS